MVLLVCKWYEFEKYGEFCGLTCFVGDEWGGASAGVCGGVHGQQQHVWWLPPRGGQGLLESRGSDQTEGSTQDLLTMNGFTEGATVLNQWRMSIQKSRAQMRHIIFEAKYSLASV